MRKASVPLHVMLKPEQMAAYRLLAKDLGLTLRDLVQTAIDGFYRGAVEPVPLQVAERLSRLEERVSHLETIATPG